MLASCRVLIFGVFPASLGCFGQKTEVKKVVKGHCFEPKPGFFGSGRLVRASPQIWQFCVDPPPPPAAAEVVVDQLGKWRLKRPECVHLVVVPRLMTGRWRRALKRGANFYFCVDWKETWPLNEIYEPLLIFVLLPYSQCQSARA
jgi:hypothetical protein